MLQVLEPQPEGPRITPFLAYQLERAWAFDAARQERFARVETEADLVALQDELRRKALAVIGGLPGEKSPLNARVTGTIPMDGYRIEKLVFESLPGIHVTALVYVPEGPAGRSRPCSLACGHSPVGKAYPGYQEIAVRLARRGYVVLCWDPVGQGERSQFWDTGARAQPLQPRLRRARGPRQLRDDRRHEPRALHGVGRHAGRRLPARARRRGRRRGSRSRARAAAASSRSGSAPSTRASPPSCPSCFPTALPMRMANRIFEDPDSDPEQDPPGLVSEGIDHPGLLLLAYPRPLHVSAAVLDFFPIEGTRKTMREVAAFYRRFGHADRVALSQGYHKHQYSAENQAKAFAFLDRAFGRPAPAGLGEAKTLPPEALWCTPSGQVREDLGGRSLMEVIRDEARARRLRRGRSASSIAAPATPASATGRSCRSRAWRPATRSPGRRSAAIASGPRSSTATACTTAAGSSSPSCTCAGRAARAATSLLRLGLEGKIRPGDWPEVEARLAEGHEVVSFDPRGLGETRMRYKAASIDDPALAPADEEAAYASPLSGVLANHVYNAQLLGRPYLFEMIEDVEIAVRFARARLGAREVAIDAPGDARLLARAVAAALPDVALVRPATAETAFDWKEAVESLRETWPIHYLVPGGAALRFDGPGGAQP